MNILYVCGHDPRDTSFGGPQRTNSLWKALQNVGDVYTVCYYPKEGRLGERIVAVGIEGPKGLKSYPNRVIRRIWDLFDKEGKKVFPVASEFSIKNPYPSITFDVVVCRYMEPAAVFHLWKIARLFVDVDDHPIQAFDTRDCLTLKWWQRPVARLLQLLEFKMLERKIIRGWVANPEHVLLCNFREQTFLLRNIPRKPSSCYNKEAMREPYLFSIGFMQYQPNYMGIDKFLSEVWPIVHQSFPHLHYYIGGKNAPDEYVDRWNSIPGVQYLGYVEDLDSLYEHCLATVVAVDQGSGTCIKTLESMAYARICLSRPFGLRGLEQEALDGTHGVFVYQNATDFLKILSEVVLIDKVRCEQENRAYNFIAYNYSEEAFVASVRSCFETENK